MPGVCAKAGAKNTDLRNSKKVIHKKYGTGIVEEVNGNEITVNFGDEHGIKHLDIEWAPIEFEWHL